MEEWKEYKLGDVCNTISDTYKRKAPEVVLINTSDVLEGKCLNHIKTLNKDLKGQFKKTFQKDDILYSEIRPANKRFAYIDFDATDYIASTKLMVLRHNEKINPQYLFYILKSKSVIEELQMLAESRSGTFPQITFSELANLKIKLPSINEQIQILSVLKSLDDKIELNRQINDNLEQQAQALFNHYFVENTELLGEYDEVCLLDIASYTNGLAMQKYRPSEDETSYLPVMKIKELGQGFTDSNSDICTCNIPEIYIINSGDIIFSWSGTLMVKIWCGETAGLNQHLFKVSSESYEKWFYYFWTKYHLRKFINIAKDKAVTMGHIKREDLAKSKVILPNQATLQNLNKIFSPIMDSIINNEIESKQQVQLRDTLLPRLMSGELKIDEINC